LPFAPVRPFALIIFLWLFAYAATAQMPVAKTPILADSIPHHKVDTLVDDNRMDIRDVAKLLFKKTKLFDKKKGDGPYIVTIPYPGYSIATGVAGVLPINISFFTNKKEKGELSFFNNNFQYTQYKQAIVLSLSNVFFGHDKWELIGDYRYYNFPTYTYGLGMFTTLGNEDQINYQQLRFYETIMRNVAKDIDVGIGYHFDYHWDISDFDYTQNIITPFSQYGLSKNSRSSGFSIDFLYDSRNNANTPKEGIYFAMQYRTFAKALGGDANWGSLIFDFRKYFRIPIPNWTASFAIWSYIWLTPYGAPPYLDMPSTGWDFYNNTGRGYALGRYRGQNMLYLEGEFRFSIMRNGFLGGVVFGNLQSFSQWPGNNFAGIAPGIGAGLRIKLNKRTDTNSALDYGFGTGGSNGFASNLNEVF
jgi:Omp85 superfamily domain